MTPMSLVIFAPGGCGDADACLAEVRAQAAPGDEIAIVVPDAIDSPPCRVAGHQGVRHVPVGTQEIFRMRLDACRAAAHPRIVLLEEHGLPDTGLLAQVREAFDRDDQLCAITFYAVNATPGRLGGRLMFTWVFHGATPERYPGPPRPVCSTFAIDRERLASVWGVLLDHLDPGDLELQAIPEAVAAHPASGFTGAIRHHEDLGYPDTVEAVFASSRLTGARERERNPQRRWAKVVRRYASHARSTVRDGGLGPIEALAVIPVALGGLLGETLGSVAGPGSAAATLARHHPAAES